MKQLLNKLHTPDSWKRNLYSEIERTENAPAVKNNKPRIAMRICAGAVALCAAFALVFALAPENDSYNLLLSAEEVEAYTKVEFGEFVTVFDNEKDFKLSSVWHTYPNGMELYESGDEQGMVDAYIFGQMPVRVSGDNIESVTLTPHNTNNNVSLALFTPTNDMNELDSMERDNKPSITLTYEEQFNPANVIALRWDYKDYGVVFNEDRTSCQAAVIDPETGEVSYNVPGNLTKNAISDTTVDIQINMKDGSAKTVTVSATHTIDEENVHERFIFQRVDAE